MISTIHRNHSLRRWRYNLGNDIISRLDAIEARFQISELRSQYAWYAARGNAENIANLFTEDGVFEMYESEGRIKTLVGRSTIEAHFKGMRKGMRVPMITNEIVRINGDAARGTSAILMPISPSSDRAYGGHYIDDFVKVDGIWLFKRRNFYYYWPTCTAAMDADPFGNS